MEDDRIIKLYRDACIDLSDLYLERANGIYGDKQQVDIFRATEREKNLRGRVWPTA